MAIITPQRAQFITTKDGISTVSLPWIKFFESLSTATNQTADDINEKIPQTGLVNQLLARVAELEKRREVLVSTSIALTANAFETIECTNTSLVPITLDPNAVKNDFINVIRTGGPVDLIGPINDRTNLRINVKEFSVKVMFNGTQWRRV